MTGICLYQGSGCLASEVRAEAGDGAAADVTEEKGAGGKVPKKTLQLRGAAGGASQQTQKCE